MASAGCRCCCWFDGAAAETAVGSGEEGEVGDRDPESAGLTQGLKVSSLLDAAASEWSLLLAFSATKDDAAVTSFSLAPPGGNHMSEAEEENTIPEEME